MNAFEYIIKNCVDISNKNILIIYDNSTEGLVELLECALIKMDRVSDKVKLDIIHCHGEEPPIQIKQKMLTADAVMCMTRYSLAHTDARRLAEKRGIAFLSMPAYNSIMIKNPALFVDYVSKIPQVKKYAEMLTCGKILEIISERGTHLFMDISERRGNCCPGLTNNEFLLGSPPDIEANIAPIERKTYGTLIIDGSVTDRRIGLLREPIRMDISDGMIRNISSNNLDVEKKVKKIIQDIGDLNAYIIGEFGIGFNDYAKLCGNMLIDEGALGCIHFGVGSNWTIGGINKVNFHLDFVLRNATVFIDHSMVIKEGRVLYA